MYTFLPRADRCASHAMRERHYENRKLRRLRIERHQAQKTGKMCFFIRYDDFEGQGKSESLYIKETTIIYVQTCEKTEKLNG
jgi:hypothetical protein